MTACVDDYDLENGHRNSPTAYLPCTYYLSAGLDRPESTVSCVFFEARMWEHIASVYGPLLPLPIPSIRPSSASMGNSGLGN